MSRVLVNISLVPLESASRHVLYPFADVQILQVSPLDARKLET
jgi:hypothetical protein